MNIKKRISCSYVMTIMVSMLIVACGDYHVNYECDLGKNKCEDNVIYECVEDVGGYRYWEKEICKFGCYEYEVRDERDETKMEIDYVCKECDPGDGNNRYRCEQFEDKARYSVCNEDGRWDAVLCPSNKCSEDGISCACPDKCVNGCNSDGECKKVGGCNHNDYETGACICLNGNNDDGSCRCPKECKRGCDNDGRCITVEGCGENNPLTGDCVCQNGNDENGKCLNICINENLFNETDGACACHGECKVGCFPNGLCKEIGNCIVNEDCNEYDSCRGNQCYCDSNKKRCALNDANGNHLKDSFEGDIKNRSCVKDGDCVGATSTGEKFCDSAMGYKCSVKCTNNTDCVDGFICRSDGRCVSEFFTTVWDKEIRKKKLEIHVSDCKNIEIYWDWKDNVVNVPELIENCTSVLLHDYSRYSSPDDDTDVIVKIKGELNGVNFYSDLESKDGCAFGCRLLEVRSFGLTGFALRKLDNGDERGAFEQCYMLRKLSEVDIPDPSKLTSMKKMFTNACSLNSPMEHWDVSNVTDMQKLFWMPNCTPEVAKSCFKLSPSFNQPLNRWNVSKVTDMNNMFQYLPSFNQSLDGWDVSNVTDMKGMFANMPSFNYPIGNWDVSNVTDMSYMFNEAYSFNQDLSGWDVSKVTTMQSMFEWATSFDQDLSKWNPKSIDLITNAHGRIIAVYSMIADSGLVYDYKSSSDKKTTNYCKIYNSKNWSELTSPRTGIGMGDADVECK